MQFAQLIGYPLTGFGELPYVTNAAYDAAREMLDNPDVTVTQAQIRVLENQLQALRDSLREPMATLFRVHPDDLNLRG